MRRPLIAGNWKMNLDARAAVQLADDVAAGLSNATAEVALCPPSVYLQGTAEVLADTPVELGAQNMYHEAVGAFTGELSAEMLLDVGCRYVILGHSERRHILGEGDEEVNRKVRRALQAKLGEKTLSPILCVGETLGERESDATSQVIRRQAEAGLAGLAADEVVRVVLAYEPVWAIGTGRVATPDLAAEVHAELRKILLDRYNADVAASVRILYGGSVKPDNARDLLTRPDIDGALVGGASLQADDFLEIVAVAA